MIPFKPDRYAYYIDVGGLDPDETLQRIKEMKVKKELPAPLSLDAYQEGARDTATYPGRGETLGLCYVGLGLTGEAGEFADKVKKILRDDAGKVSPERREALIGELGDVLWYVASCCDELGVSLDDVAKGNLAKLASRKSRGKLQGSGDNR